jgi:copper chaperone NosL
MRRLLVFLSLSFVCCASLPAFANDKVEDPQACKQCGMNRTKFAQSRMVVTYQDGDSVGTCSLNCVAADMKAKPGKKVASLQVADCKTRALIDAKSATWVIGGKKSGVMTDLPKWAFEKKPDAEAFLATNGGRIAGFDEALALAEKEQE